MLSNPQADKLKSEEGSQILAPNNMSGLKTDTYDKPINAFDYVLEKKNRNVIVSYGVF